jgi:hypothetical protein
MDGEFCVEIAMPKDETQDLIISVSTSRKSQSKSS